MIVQYPPTSEGLYQARIDLHEMLKQFVGIIKQFDDVTHDETIRLLTFISSKVSLGPFLHFCMFAIFKILILIFLLLFLFGWDLEDIQRHGDVGVIPDDTRDFHKD